MKLWIPGKFPSLNDGFKLARESGVLAAGAKARGIQRPRDPFNDEARRVLQHVRVHARRELGRPRFGDVYAVRVHFFGHTRWDSDAGGWALKLIIDALFGHNSDRRVEEATATVVRADRASDLWSMCWGYCSDRGPGPLPPPGTGAFVEVLVRLRDGGA